MKKLLVVAFLAFVLSVFAASAPGSEPGNVSRPTSE